MIKLVDFLNKVRPLAALLGLFSMTFTAAPLLYFIVPEIVQKRFNVPMVSILCSAGWGIISLGLYLLMTWDGRE